jgi:hypothetical protein
VGHAEGAYAGGQTVTLDLYCVGVGRPGRFVLAPSDARRLAMALLDVANGGEGRTVDGGPPT